MRVLVVGASGGSGRAAVDELVRRHHEVTALVRKPEALADSPAGVRLAVADTTRGPELEAAVRGQEAVIVTLGIRENPLRVRLRGPRTTPVNVRSIGTARVIEAMQRHDVRRLVVQSSYGVGDTRERLPWKWRLIFALVLKPQIADTELQERLVAESNVAWTLARPVSLTDSDAVVPQASADGVVRSMEVSRKTVARFLVDAVEGRVPSRTVFSVS